MQYFARKSLTEIYPTISEGLTEEDMKALLGREFELVKTEYPYLIMNTVTGDINTWEELEDEFKSSDPEMWYGKPREFITEDEFINPVSTLLEQADETGVGLIEIKYISREKIWVQAEG